MKFCYPQINKVFEIENKTVNTIIIENKKLFFEIVCDIYQQTEGMTGKAILSDGDKILDFSKKAEIITSFVPFNLNKKSLITKIMASLESEAINQYNYQNTMQLMAEIERFLDELGKNYNANINFTKVTPAAIIKASGMEIVDDYDTISEKIIDYLELLREFECEKLLILVNLRSFIDDNETKLFMKTILDHEFKILMIENREYKKIEYESRIVVDEDLCEF